MKNSARFIVAALILAGVAALGFSRGAWAGPFMQGTVPSCPTTDSTPGGGFDVICNSYVQAYLVSPTYTVTATETDITPFGLPPEGQFTNGVNVTFTDQNGNPVPELLIDVCFPDPTGAGVIYRYWTTADWMTYFNSNEPGRWVVSPTFNEAEDPAGFTCTETWNSGIYTIVY
jgi:hypothetical protein